MPDQGWYQNPVDAPGTSRWWDGDAWTSRTRTTPPPTARPRAEAVTALDHAVLGSFPRDPYPAPGASPPPNADDALDDEDLDDEYDDYDEDDYEDDEDEGVAVARPRSLVRTLVTTTVVAGLAVGAFFVVRHLRADDDPAPLEVTRSSTTTTQGATTVPGPTAPPFESALGWTFPAGAGWTTDQNDPNATTVLWLTPGGAIATVEVEANPEGTKTTATSVKPIVLDYLKQRVSVGGTPFMIDTTMGGRWAVRADASDERSRAIVVAGSTNGRDTVIVSLLGRPDQVAAALPAFEQALIGFTYR
jgi:hypothetical protein